MLRAWGTSDKGSVRATNQDSYAIEERFSLCVVADGMGGHNAGDVAARTAVETVVAIVADRFAGRLPEWPYGFDRRLSDAGNLMRTAIQFANARILGLAGSCAAYTGMGTTIVAALEAGGCLTVAHVGDSRLYRFSGGRVRQLTGDDSWAAALLASDPRADASALRHHPLRHVLTNVVGNRRDADVHVAEERLTAGDRLLLTTDGVHGVLDDERLEQALRSEEEPGGVPAALVRVALASGSADNCTAVVAEYRPDPPESA